MNVTKPSSAQRESARCGAPGLGDALSAPQPVLRAELSGLRKRILAPHT
jgi:hypothetical protein